MAWDEVRFANEAGRAVAVLSPSLEVIHWANSPARALLSLDEAPAGSAPLDPDLPSTGQLQALATSLAAEGEAMGRMRTRIGESDVVTTAHLFLARLAPGIEVALLAAPVPGFQREPREALADRLFREAGGEGARAALVDEAGTLIRSPMLSEARADELAELAQEFFASGQSLLSIEEDGEEMLFARVSSDFAFARIVALVPAVEAVPAPADGDIVEPKNEVEPAETAEEPAAPSPATPMSALIDRWFRRLGPSAPQPDQTPTQEDAGGPAAPIEAPEEEDEVASDIPSFQPRLDGDPVRFVWQIDASGRFCSFSPEFAGAVGPNAADVIGLEFGGVAALLGFGEAAIEIARLVERRDTWSGRSIHWPIEGTSRSAVVDLAALPMYDAARSFQGFRGFGIVRLDETVEDPRATGLKLARVGIAGLSDERDDEDGGLDAFLEEIEPGSTARLADLDVAGAETSGLEEPAEEAHPSRETGAIARPTFGRRGNAPAPTPDQGEDRRRPRERPLSPEEASAFRAIGAKLNPLTGEPPLPPKEDQEEASSTEGEIAALFAAMPIPALLMIRGEPAHASREFFGFTGYETLEAFAAAGGLDTLFVDEPPAPHGDGECVAMRAADGTRLKARVQMQRLTFDGRSGLAFFFTPFVKKPNADEGTGAAAEAAAEAEAEAAGLREEIAELHAVLDTATDGILLLDPAGRVRSMNGPAEALLGLSPERYQGLAFADLLAPESRRAALDYLETLRDGGLAGILNDGREVLGQVGQGGTVPLFVTIGRLSAERGWCVVMRDIAQWKRIEGELTAARRQAEDASLHKSRFLANVSHELRTPLNAIIGFADVMASECFGPIGHERYLEYLGDIKRSGHHVLDLVNDLLDISKIEAGKVELAFEAVHLNEVVSEVVSLMQPQANRERVLVRSNLPDNVPAVVADRRSLRQIALNLISNAIRFTPAGGQIIASTSYAPSGEVALRFRDSGIGMTEREIEIALTPFRQVNGAARERGEGTGLGLPLTKAMTEANRANFAISSTPGEGTVIEIVFPPQRVLAE